MTGRVQPQTSYLSFVLHEQDLSVKFCSTQKSVNRNKMDKTAYIIWYEEQFITAPHAKTTPHDEQFCHVRLLDCEAILFHITIKCACGTKLLHMTIFAPRTKSIVSATNMMYVQTLMDNQAKGVCCKMATKKVTSLSLNLSHFVGWPLSMGKHSLRPD